MLCARCNTFIAAFDALGDSDIHAYWEYANGRPLNPAPYSGLAFLEGDEAAMSLLPRPPAFDVVGS